MCGPAGAAEGPLPRRPFPHTPGTRLGPIATTPPSSRAMRGPKTPEAGSDAPVTEIAIHDPAAERMGFFTDTTVCIGCKACEVACKQWNDLPADGHTFGRRGSYDSTGAL